MSFNDSFNKQKLKNRATSNTKIQQLLGSIGLHKVGINLRDRPFSTDIGIVSLHLPKRTHWVCYVNENYFDRYRCGCQKKLFKFIIKRKGFCFYSEYKIPGLTYKKDSYCATYFLLIIFWTKVLKIGFKPAVLSLYYQKIR